jgi:hypothetical protein
MKGASPKVNIRCRVKEVQGFYFISPTMLHQHLVPQSKHENVCLIILQHDSEVPSYLVRTFKDNWCGHGTPIAWLLSSSNVMHPCQFLCVEFGEY